MTTTQQLNNQTNYCVSYLIFVVLKRKGDLQKEEVENFCNITMCQKVSFHRRADRGWMKAIDMETTFSMMNAASLCNDCIAP